MTDAVGPVAGGISTDTSRLASKENLEAAGKRFEAIFVNMMLGSMRKAKLAEGLFDSQGQEQFRDMQDQQLASTMAAHAPIGIGKAMTEFLGRSVQDAGAAAKPANDGGAA